MKSYLTMTAALAALTAAAVPATAHECQEARAVRSYYRAYLHRAPDKCGLDNWVRQLERGLPPEAVQAGILGSEEYFDLHGHCPKDFVAGLYEDVLGREPCRREIEQWSCRLRECGCRVTLAKEFLCAADRELAGRAPAPVYVPVPQPRYVPVPVEPVAPTGVRFQIRYNGR